MKIWTKNDYTDFPNKEMKGIMKIVKSLEELDLLLKGVSETIENEAKRPKSWI